MNDKNITSTVNFPFRNSVKMNKFCKYLADLKSSVIVKAYISTSYGHQVTKQRCMLFYEVFARNRFAWILGGDVYIEANIKRNTWHSIHSQPFGVRIIRLAFTFVSYSVGSLSLFSCIFVDKLVLFTCQGRYKIYHDTPFREFILLKRSRKT